MIDRPAVTIHLPPSRDHLPASVIKLIEEYEDLLAQRREAAAKLDQLERSRPAVEQRDAADSAQALRAGKPVAEQKHLQAHVAEVARVRHLALSLTTAVDETARELIAAVEGAQASIIDRTDKAAAKGDRAYERAVDATAKAHDAALAARAQANWARAFPGRSKGASVRGIPVDAMNGEPLGVDVALARLREVVAP